MPESRPVDAVSDRVEALRVSLLFDQRPASYVLVYVVAAACAFLLRHEFPAWHLGGWLVLIYTAETLHWLFTRRFFTPSVRPRTAKQWEDHFSLWAFGMSLLWGAGAFAFFPGTSSLLQVIFGFALLVLLAGTTASYAASAKCVNAALVPAISLLVLRLLMEATEVHVAMAILSTLLVGGLAGIGRKMHQSMIELLRLRCERDGLFEANVSAARLGVVGELASSVGHEVNNPLMVVSGYAGRTLELLREGTLTPEATVSSMETIEKSSQRIADLIRGMMLFSRETNRETLEPTPLATVVEQAAALSRRRAMKRGAKLDVGPVPAGITLNCHTPQLCQAILIGIGNALDAVEPLENKWVRLDVTDQGEAVEIAITDAGKLPANSNPEDWFRLFYTTKEGRARGLGLGIARAILERHGGTIRFDAAAPSTRLVMRFPKLVSKPAASPTAEAAAKAA